MLEGKAKLWLFLEPLRNQRNKTENGSEYASSTFTKENLTYTWANFARFSDPKLLRQPIKYVPMARGIFVRCHKFAPDNRAFLDLFRPIKTQFRHSTHVPKILNIPFNRYSLSAVKGNVLIVAENRFSAWQTANQLNQYKTPPWNQIDF